MYQIVNKQNLNPTVTLMDIKAPYVAAKAEAGQFIILRVDADGERIPLTVAGYDRQNGTVRIIFQIVGATTEKLNHLNVGDSIHDFVGPLGTATKLDGLKKVCIVGGGVGCAIALPIAQKLHEMGCNVTSIIGFRSKDIVILEDDFRAVSDRMFLMTDDGSYGEKAFTTQKLEELIQKGEKFDEIVAVGPPIMMKLVCEIAAKYNIPSVASLTAYMIDGTGMCGGCRCMIGGEDKFVCVDGPEFDGSLVDWDDLLKRSNYYKDQEAEDRAHVCRLTGGVRYHD